MKVRLFKHGENLAFMLPQDLIDQLEIREGDDLSMEIIRRKPPEIAISKTIPAEGQET